MKKFVIVVLFSIFAFTSCVNEETKQVIVEKNEKVEQVNDANVVILNDPAVFCGTDFMSFMQSSRKIGNYDLMVQFTSSASVKKLGKEKVKAYFEEKLTNMSKLKLISVTSNSDGTKTLNYVNTSVATKSATSVAIVIENDSCKIVLPTDLKKKLLN